MKFKQFLLKYRRVFVIWAIVGFIVHLALALYFKPWTSKLGVSMDPQRFIIGMVIAEWWVLKLPIALLAMSLVAGKEKWLAPRGKYQEGVKYPVFTTYAFVAIALCSALMGASGIVSGYFFDLSAVVAVFAVSFFNPIIGFFTLYLGGILRALLFAIGNPVIWALGPGFSDGTIWIYLGILYWWFREETKWGKNVIYTVIWWAVMYWVGRTVLQITWWFWLDPVPALWARLTWFYTNMLPTGTLSSVAGILVAETVIRVVERERAPIPTS